MNTVILIPARYASTRYPGKPLVELKGSKGDAKPLIQRSVEAARRVPGVDGVFVTTDDERIAEACKAFRVGVIMTSPECRNGTERCAEALTEIHDPDLVINFQGDALLTPPGFVTALIDHMAANPDASVATPAMRQRASEVRALQAEETQGRVGGTSVVTANNGQALYFSKKLIPYLPNHALDGELSPVRLHIGIYAYRVAALRRLASLPVSRLEQIEKLEQLRALENGMEIRVALACERPLADVNTAADLERAERALSVRP